MSNTSTAIQPRKQAIQPTERRLSLSMSDYREVMKRPLLALPEDVRPAALACWTVYKHLKGMETAMSISAAVSVWIDRHGLRTDDATEILMRMVAPHRMQGYEFASQFMTALAGEVTQAIERRKTEAENRRRRLEQERYDAEAATTPQVKLSELFAGIGNSVEP